MGPLRQAPPASSPAVLAVMKGNHSVDTRPEVALRSALHRAGLRFTKNVRPAPGFPRTDILFTRARVAVFVDGCFWHRCPEHFQIPKANRRYWEAKFARNVERDRQNDAELTAADWTVLRFFEHVPVDVAANDIQAVVLAAVA